VPVDTLTSKCAAPPVTAARIVLARLAAIAGSPAIGMVLKFAISAGLIALVCRHIDGSTLAASFAGQNPLWIGGTALIGLLQIGLLTLRWQQILRALGAESGLGSALAVTYMGCFFGSFLLGPTGSDIARAVLAPPRRLGRTGIVHSVLFERLASVAGLGLAAAPFVMFEKGPLTSGPLLVIALAMVPLPVVAMVGIAWLARIFAGREGTIFVALREFDQSRRQLCRAWPRFAAAVAMATAGQVLVAGEAWCLAQAQHLDVSFLDFALLMPPVMLLVALPISAGGWGVREGAMVAALALVGVGSAPALLLSVELGLLTTLVSLPGGAIWLYRCFGRSSRRTASGRGVA
jgi:uncharacterized membrane protein YbhN (UPF0104 family)